MAPNPGGTRDLFVTPNWVVDGILSHLPLDGSIVEPAAGDGLHFVTSGGATG